MPLFDFFWITTKKKKKNTNDQQLTQGNLWKEKQIFFNLFFWKAKIGWRIIFYLFSYSILFIYLLLQAELTVLLWEKNN